MKPQLLMQPSELEEVVDRQVQMQTIGAECLFRKIILQIDRNYGQQ